MTRSEGQRGLVLRLLAVALAMSAVMSTVALWVLRRLGTRPAAVVDDLKERS